MGTAGLARTPITGLPSLLSSLNIMEKISDINNEIVKRINGEGLLSYQNSIRQILMITLSILLTLALLIFICEKLGSLVATFFPSNKGLKGYRRPKH